MTNMANFEVISKFSYRYPVVFFFCKSKSVFIVIENATLRTLCIHLLSTICFDHLWPSSGRFHNNKHGKAYRIGSLPFTVNIL